MIIEGNRKKNQNPTAFCTIKNCFKSNDCSLHTISPIIDETIYKRLMEYLKNRYNGIVITEEHVLLQEIYHKAITEIYHANKDELHLHRLQLTKKLVVGEVLRVIALGNWATNRAAKNGRTRLTMSDPKNATNRIFYLLYDSMITLMLNRTPACSCIGNILFNLYNFVSIHQIFKLITYLLLPIIIFSHITSYPSSYFPMIILFIGGEDIYVAPTKQQEAIFIKATSEFLLGMKKAGVPFFTAFSPLGGDYLLKALEIKPTSDCTTLEPGRTDDRPLLMITKEISPVVIGIHQTHPGNLLNGTMTEGVRVADGIALRLVLGPITYNGF